MNEIAAMKYNRCEMVHGLEAWRNQIDELFRGCWIA